MIPIRSVCKPCLDNFSEAVDHKQLTGAVNCYCTHHKVLLATTTESGVITSWLLSPAENREQAEATLQATTDAMRRELYVDALLNGGSDDGKLN